MDTDKAGNAGDSPDSFRLYSYRCCFKLLQIAQPKMKRLTPRKEFNFRIASCSTEKDWTNQREVREEGGRTRKQHQCKTHPLQIIDGLWVLEAKSFLCIFLILAYIDALTPNSENGPLIQFERLETTDSVYLSYSTTRGLGLTFMRGSSNIRKFVCWAYTEDGNMLHSSSIIIFHTYAM